MKAIMRVMTGLLLLAWLATGWTAPKIETWHTANGAKVLYVHTPDLPMVDIEVTFDAGSARDGKAWGLAAITNALLDAGTKGHDENAIAEGFNALGAQFGTSADRDMASLTLRTLARQPIMDEAVALFTEVLSQPAFPEGPFVRVKRNTLTALKEEEMKPSTLAARAFWKALYGDHPYAHPVSGLPETVKGLQLEQVRAFYKRYYVAKNGLISIVGAVDRKQAEALAERIMGALPAGKKAAPLPAPKPLDKAVDIEKPFQSTQTYYYLGQLGIKRGDADYYALFLGNHLLGGAGFGSLLMEEVREKRGLVYSVYSYFLPLKQPGPWLVSLSTKNATAYEADKVVRQTLKAFMQHIDPDKLQAIKDNLLGGWPLRFDSNAKILGYINMIGFYDLPLDYLERFPREIERLTADDVLAAWRRHIHPDRLVKVMVGGFKASKAQ
ncbi:zinc protease [Sulfurivirga caldicuralii]|uniref:Zinc protease n=2 Tax=Sulfurivirga caldicuralii TaxID=364032 RepID=A0A1N6GXA8_9GAMM|nr:zinc protease [Sulfurivirga caldicuralii]